MSVPNWNADHFCQEKIIYYYMRKINTNVRDFAHNT
jgi:hypothetical protein